MMMRYVIESMMELLSSRTSFKNEFRMQMTTIRPVENNPLKFSPSLEDALRIFLGDSSSSYLTLEESVEGCMVDMRNHQLAMVSGLQAVFAEVAGLLEPERYVEESAGGVKGALQTVNRKSRAWDKFCAYCESLERDSSNGVAGNLSEIFSTAYEEQSRMLGDKGGSSR